MVCEFRLHVHIHIWEFNVGFSIHVSGKYGTSGVLNVSLVCCNRCVIH